MKTRRIARKELKKLANKAFDEIGKHHLVKIPEGGWYPICASDYTDYYVGGKKTPHGKLGTKGFEYRADIPYRILMRSSERERCKALLEKLINISKTLDGIKEGAPIFSKLDPVTGKPTSMGAIRHEVAKKIGLQVIPFNHLREYNRSVEARHRQLGAIKNEMISTVKELQSMGVVVVRGKNPLTRALYKVIMKRGGAISLSSKKPEKK